MIYLKCGCSIKEDGTFVVGKRCEYCAECNAMVELHPFGEKRFEELGFHSHH
ncbi:hypothetical protein HY449_00875 [Candidatus Pacearchaeota archaeon]|nr:hypothetical protein [Candidatus Pacearchaeota archaeon]